MPTVGGTSPVGGSSVVTTINPSQPSIWTDFFTLCDDLDEIISARTMKKLSSGSIGASKTYLSNPGLRALYSS